jgi:hypothetical protein
MKFVNFINTAMGSDYFSGEELLSTPVRPCQHNMPPPSGEWTKVYLLTSVYTL